SWHALDYFGNSAIVVSPVKSSLGTHRAGSRSRQKFRNSSRESCAAMVEATRSLGGGRGAPRVQRGLPGGGVAVSQDLAASRALSVATALMDVDRRSRPTMC